MSRLPSTFCAVFFLTFALMGTLHAQLAITEVMPVTRTNMSTGFRGAEYWELTNFGTNDTNLHGFGFRDANPNRTLVKYPFTNLVLRPGESVVIYRIQDSKQSVTNESQFRAWWGTNLAAELQFRIWNDSPGLSGWDGDDIWLFDGAGHLVDKVQFARARVGRAFTYEPETGLFGLISANGVNGAFSAMLADDVGSPGTTTGPVPVRFLQEPGDRTADSNGIVSFSAVAAGMPQPRYQWFREGALIPGGTNAILSLSNVQPAAAGHYFLFVSNTLSSATSVVANLTVNTNPIAPVILNAPAGVTVFPGQAATFTVSARGLPAPAYHWRANGFAVPSITGPTLQVNNIAEWMSGTTYSVTVSNALGSTNVSARLTVVRRPDLRFTEVMALPSEGEDNQHFDWFEVTNFDSNAVDLTGWRFSDEPSFARAVAITNTLIVQPGESVVFAERLNAQLFRTWWGPENVPPTLQVCAYSGFGLGAFGETLFLWNPAATDPYDYMATLSWATATAGVSFECERYCDEGFGCVDEATANSTPGQRGAFRAVHGGHIGSPGYIANPSLSILSIQGDSSGTVTIRSRAAAGEFYRLWRSTSPLLNGTALETQVATNNVIVFTDRPSAIEPAWFYRLERIP